MSHFTVLVKVSADTLVEHNGDIEEAVRAMLAPFKESGSKEFMEFNDTTEEYKKEWEEKTVECVKLSNGQLVFKWDSRFKVKKSDEPFGEKEFVLPEGAELVDIHLNQYYNDFEEFAEEWHGAKFNEEKQAYGYWTNPNAKWDWYEIGGRWTGFLPVTGDSVTKRSGTPGLMTEVNTDDNYADIVIVGELDKGRMKFDTNQSIHKFWDKYQRFLAIEAGTIEKGEEDSWIGYEINDTLSGLGLRKCINPREEGKEALFENKPFTLEDLQTKYSWYWEFHTYAVLDDEGWHEKGEMGWWGISSESLDEAENWDKSFVHRFLDNEEDDTTLVLVDAHI